ncbi:NAC domain-containing protein 40-like isoform X3 [Prunus avium]|uniref:NAC domain-containing protein 40-like isoform X3 n=1 Tax=Prunus avium TaxID=42229 RepID=A0A6P5TAZ5_PRUAV|nr:NAC domain-containing protein 40-like isoform X3 [Prunus avium]
MISFSRAAAEGGDLTLPVGFRFRPTDEELVDYYLKNKVQGMDFHAEGIIDEIDILKFEPWDLVAKSLMKPDDESGFFFSQPEYTPKKKTKRTTEVGFWKITGREHDIRTRDRRRTVIGKKRILTFYIGQVRNSDKTNWVMHEYYIPKAHPNANQRDFVLCHLKNNVKNADVATTCDEGETHNASDVEYQPVNDMNMEDTRPPENGDYFERARDLLLANSLSNNDHNAFPPEFSANDQEFLRTLIVEPQFRVTSDTDREPVHHRVQSLQMRCEPQILYKLQCGSSQSRRDTDVILHNQLSRQASSSVNVASKPQTEVQLQSGTYQREHRPQQQSGPINVLRDTFADEYYVREILLILLGFLFISICIDIM